MFYYDQQAKHDTQKQHGKIKPGRTVFYRKNSFHERVISAKIKFYSLSTIKTHDVCPASEDIIFRPFTFI